MTFDEPLSSAYSANDELYETCVWLGCVAAKGKSTETDVFNAIWNKFQTMHLTSKDDELLSYYKYGLSTGNYNTTNDLLKYKDGRCTAWAHLFSQVLASQGIYSSIFTFNVNYLSISTFLNQKNIPYNILNAGIGQKGTVFQGDSSTNGLLFYNHFINLYNNQLYDVTCGIGNYQSSDSGFLLYLMENAYIDCYDSNVFLYRIQGNELSLDMFDYDFGGNQ